MLKKKKKKFFNYITSDIFNLFFAFDDIFYFSPFKSLSIFERLYKEKKYINNTKKGKGYSGLMGYYRLCKTK